MKRILLERNQMICTILFSRRPCHYYILYSKLEKYPLKTIIDIHLGTLTVIFLVPLLSVILNYFFKNNNNGSFYCSKHQLGFKKKKMKLPKRIKNHHTIYCTNVRTYNIPTMNHFCEEQIFLHNYSCLGSHQQTIYTDWFLILFVCIFIFGTKTIQTMDVTTLENE